MKSAYAGVLEDGKIQPEANSSDNFVRIHTVSHVHWVVRDQFYFFISCAVGVGNHGRSGHSRCPLVIAFKDCQTREFGGLRAAHALCAQCLTVCVCCVDDLI